jgi:UDP-glucuronate 4-epimerase
VIGLEHHNDYYEPELTEARLARHINHVPYTHIRGDLADRELVQNLFETHKHSQVVNLAAQAGVRYSVENP